MNDRLIATYRIESPIGALRAAEVLAAEQSIGSFIRVAGETEDVIERCGARVEAIELLGDVPSPSLATSLPGISSSTPCEQARVRISFPLANFAADVPCLAAVLMGNLFELQELTGVRLEDLDMPVEFQARFPGPRFGVEGTRKLVGVKRGPLIGTIVKPKLGLSPSQIGELCAQLFEAGLHFVKDDECMTDPPSAPFAERAQAMLSAADRAADQLGYRPMVALNVSGDASEMLRRHDLVARLGGTCVMVSVNACGPAAVESLRRHSSLPIHGHRAGWGMLTRHPQLGVSFRAVQKLWRLAGVDQLHIGGLQSKFFEEDASVAESARDCLQIDGPHRPVMPVISSGQWGGQAPATFEAIGGDDVVYLAGGGILGHPMGPAAGVEAIRQAWNAARAGLDLNEHARHHPALAASIKAFAGARQARAAGSS